VKKREGKVTFEEMEFKDFALAGRIVGSGFSSKNRALVLLDNGTSVGIDLDATEPAPQVYKPTVLPEDSSAKVYPLSEREYWAFSPSSVALITYKNDDSKVVQRAKVSFGDAAPTVLSVSTERALVRIGDTYQIISGQGKFGSNLVTPLDYRGRSTPLESVVGHGIAGDESFWISDGSKIVFFKGKEGSLADVRVQRVELEGLAESSLLSFQFEEVDGDPRLIGRAFAHNSTNGRFLRSQEPASDAVSGRPVAAVEIEDTESRELVKQNCLGCHGNSGGFNEALKIQSWKQNAEKIKTQLEKNSMPPGGAELETRQKLAALLEKLSAVKANIKDVSDEKKPEVPQDDPKLAEFNNTFKAIIERSCMGCHDHVHGRAAPAEFERIKRNAIDMKGRIDNNSMPPAAANNRINAADRAALSQWLGTLNP